MRPLIVRTGTLSWRPGRLASSSELVTEGTIELHGTYGALVVRKKGSGRCDLPKCDAV